jgi:lysophospholipase L1-like esterase
MLLFALACASSVDAPKIGPVRKDQAVTSAAEPGAPGSGDTGREDTEDEEPSEPETDDTGAETRPTPTDVYGTCFSSFMDPAYPLPDYDISGATIGSHCSGTDHQDIEDIERVVFIGDSVTLGTPPTGAADWYRNRLADVLSSRFGLLAPGWAWQNVDILAGDPLERFDGDFGVCAWWGARTDDLLLSDQLPDCLPEESRDLRTLVIITAGGNDVFKQVQSKMEGATDAEIEAATVEWVALMEEGLAWIKEPGRFPSGVHVIFANVYEYTDGGGNLGACPGASLFGFGTVDTGTIDELTRWAMGEYLRMATERGADMLFLREAFCGHGFNAQAGAGYCDRGANNAIWFDDTCIHPNAAGHGAIVDMVMSVIDE